MPFKMFENQTTIIGRILINIVSQPEQLQKTEGQSRDSMSEFRKTIKQRYEEICGLCCVQLEFSIRKVAIKG